MEKVISSLYNIQTLLQHFSEQTDTILYTEGMVSSPTINPGASQVAQWKRTHLPEQEMPETQVWSLGQEEPLEEEMTTHSSILAWKIPWTAEPGRLQSIHRVSESDTTEHTCKWDSTYVNPISQFIPSPLSPWYPQVCSLHLCLYFYFASKFICTIIKEFFKGHNKMMIMLGE